MKHLDHHLIGDTRYGDGRHNKLFRDHFDNQRLLLFATGLEFVHPYSEQKFQIQAPVPLEQQAVFDALGWIRIDSRSVIIS